MLVLNLPAFRNKKYTAYITVSTVWEIPPRKDPIKMLGFALPCDNYSCYLITVNLYRVKLKVKSLILSSMIILSDFRFQIQISYYHALFTTIIALTVLQKLHHLKREKNITIHNQNKMCSVTKVAYAFVLVSETYKQMT